MKKIVSNKSTYREQIATFGKKQFREMNKNLGISQPKPKYDLNAEELDLFEGLSNNSNSMSSEINENARI